MIKKNTILIIGAGGYIGSKMVDTLLKQGAMIIAVDKILPPAIFSDLKKNKYLQLLNLDVEKIDKSTLEGVNTIINLASISSDAAGERNPEITKRVNLTLAVDLAKKAKMAGVARYIYPSTCNVYGSSEKILEENDELHPNSTYTKTKVAAENALLKLASSLFCTTILRLSPIYGLSERHMRFDLVVHIMTLNAFTKKQIYVMGDGTQWHPLIHINDAIEAFNIIATAKDTDKINGEIFNVGGNSENYQILSVAQQVKSEFPNVKISYKPESSFGRDYRVNFDKFSKRFKFKTNKKVIDGIREIKMALENKLIQIPEPFSK